MKNYCDGRVTLFAILSQQRRAKPAVRLRRIHPDARRTNQANLSNDLTDGCFASLSMAK